MHVLLLREEENPNDRYHEEFMKENISAYSIPVLDFEFYNLNQLKEFSENIDKYSGLVFTSKRAIHAFKEVITDKTIEEIQGKQDFAFYVVGRSSESCLQQLGLQSLGGDTGNAAELSELIINRECNSKRPIMFACGNLARETIPKCLSEAKIPNEYISCYKTVPNKSFLDDLEYYLEKEKPDGIVFFSPSGAEFYLKNIKEKINNFSTVHIVCIGEYTAETLRKLGENVSAVAEKPTPISLVAKIKELL